jgi:hypothetical protein
MLRAWIESDWLRTIVHRWKGAITVTVRTVFEN